MSTVFLYKIMFSICPAVLYVQSFQDNANKVKKIYVWTKKKFSSVGLVSPLNCQPNWFLVEAWTFLKIWSCETLFWGIPADTGSSLDAGFPHLLIGHVLLVQTDYWKSILLITTGHLETSSIVGLPEGPLLYLVKIKKTPKRGRQYFSRFNANGSSRLLLVKDD